MIFYRQFTSLEVFVVFNSTKVNSKEKKQNKQDLFFILHKKNIKIHLVVLENELFEVAVVVSKKQQKQKHIDHACYGSNVSYK